MGEPQIRTRVVAMFYAGGIIGLFISKRAALEMKIHEFNRKGYRLRHVLPSKTGVFIGLLQTACLMVTLFLWAPEPGETLVFEKME
ncbi:MAG: hypothetical protein JXX28_14215 [Deltaproteobacteria bacterium]|nr:hypothetical protein [Deltaproteobacteria bacterium]